LIFHDVKNSIVEILGNSESGRFRTIGFKDRPASAESLLNRDRTVMVYYRAGQFNGAIGGPADHAAEFIIELSVARSAEADLATIDSPDSDDTDRAVALANMQDSRDLANDSLDELADIVLNIINDNRNRDLGMDVGEAADRWIPELIKNDLTLMGSLMVLTARMRLTCNMEEEFLGDIPVEAETPILNMEINTQGDEEITSLAAMEE